MKTKDLRHIYYVDSMLREAEFFISAERLAGERLVKFFCHSQYATDKLRQTLRRLQREGKIAFWIKGEDFHANDEGTRYLLDRFPGEEADEMMNKEDTLCSVVCLSLP